ncbi:MAG TPA: hypothetical protein VFD92_14500 [Candidatus Binatia bacterium]|nr:hypothetical protein [Candidatus Binatia bacterium]
MSEPAKILRGPWRAPVASRPAPENGSEARAPAPADELGPNRMHLGFVVRECAVALGHAPSPAELAWWANHQMDERGEFRLFGREISTAEARIILKHPGRAVTVRPERARPRSAARDDTSASS